MLNSFVLIKKKTAKNYTENAADIDNAGVRKKMRILTEWYFGVSYPNEEVQAFASSREKW